MQKKLIALAVAGLVSAPAFAQSNVTIYGVADAAIGIGEHGQNDFQGVVNGVLSGSRIGFRGTEDLGNGLKAVFTLEQGFDIGNGVSSPGVGGDSTFSRQAFVGLGGSFGTVSLGRQYAPGYFFNYDAVLGAQVSPQSILSNGAGMSITPNSRARWDNSLAYTGSFSGLTVRGIYSANAVEFGANPEDDDAYGLSVDYANGPLKVGVVYQTIQNNANDQKEWGVGGSYDFGFLTLAGSYQDAESIGFGNVDGDVWQVGVIVPVSAAGNVHVGYGEADRDGTTGAESWTVAYTHALSKRTTAYVGYNSTENERNAGGYGLVPGTGNGGKANLFVGGIRHTF